MVSIFRARSSPRLLLLAAILSIGALLILGRLFFWQVVKYDEMLQKSEEYRVQAIPQLARRGDIVTSDGVLLAADLSFYQILAHPKDETLKERLDVTAAALAPVLGSTEAELVRKMQVVTDTVVLVHAAPSSVKPKLDQLRADSKIPGIEYNMFLRRHYPGDALLAHVVGFVNAERKGAYGVEQYYNDTLRGQNGRLVGISDVLRAIQVWFGKSDETRAIDGSTLVLTINSAMQNVAEQELARAVTENGAMGGQIIILDAKDSAVLAMASQPAPDLNAYGTTDLAQYNNPAISAKYEPGSVFKIVTLAAGLDSGKISPGIVFNDTGKLLVGGVEVKNHDNLYLDKPGLVDLVGMMKQSLNVEACRIALATGANPFYEYVGKFGFGTTTGVDLAGEIGGTVKKPGGTGWYESYLCTNAFGQGIDMPALQMANALAVVANGGKLNRPYVVSKIVGSDGSGDVRGPQFIRQVIKPETARMVTDILTRSVGAESNVVIHGYRIAGKTGTSQIPKVGGYDDPWTIASFGGWLPAEQAKFVILIKIDRPVKSRWGSTVAAPVFKRVAEQLILLEGILPDDGNTAKK